MQNYNSILICVLMLLSYFGSYGLVKTKKISLISHRKIWNILLLVSFLISGILGLILAVFLDNKLDLTWYREMLWWHVEAGIVMAVIAIFHAAWHTKYYLHVFVKNKH